MKIAACLIVKDEASDIAEWVAFHMTAGFDTLLIYDNASRDGTAAILRAASRVFDVRVIPWPDGSPSAQMRAYMHAMKTFGPSFEWIAVIDSDEFVVTEPGHSLRSLCGAAGDAGGIALNWAMFGTNGLLKAPPCLVIEAFTRRSEKAFPPNRHVKCIVRPGRVRAGLNPHAFSVSGGIVAPDGSSMVWMPNQPGLSASVPEYGIARVNHYFTRSRAHWERKVLRGYPNPVSREKLTRFEDYDRNEVEDRSALQNVAAVRQARSRILERVVPEKAPVPYPAGLQPRLTDMYSALSAAMRMLSEESFENVYYGGQQSGRSCAPLATANAVAELTGQTPAALRCSECHAGRRKGRR